MSTSIAALRALIEQRFPDATPLTGGAQTTEQVATGIAALDKVLPNGGLPRGRLSVWAPQGGATAILRATCYSIVLGGERSAWIDGDNTVAGAFWSNAAARISCDPSRASTRCAPPKSCCGRVAFHFLY